MSGRDVATPAPPDRTRDGPALAQARFARRQWRRRWLAWRYAAGRGAGPGARRRRHLARLLLVGAGRASASRSAGPDRHVPQAGAVDRAGADEGEPLARVDLGAIASAGSARWPSSRSVDVSRQWPDTACCIVDRGAGPDRRRRDRRPAARHGRRRRGVPRLRQGAARAARGSSSDLGTTSDALQEAATVIAALPQELAALRRPRRGARPSTRSRWCSRTGGRWCGGARTSPTPRPRCSPTLLASVQAQVYDVSVPGQAHHRDRSPADPDSHREFRRDAPSCPRVATAATTARPYCRRHGRG